MQTQRVIEAWKSPFFDMTLTSQASPISAPHFDIGPTDEFRAADATLQLLSFGCPCTENDCGPDTFSLTCTVTTGCTLVGCPTTE